MTNGETATTEMQDVKVQGKSGYAALGLFIAGIEEELAWATRRSLISLNIRKKEDGWLLIVTARMKGKKEVAFLTGDSPIACYRHLYAMLKGGRMPWVASKY